MIHSVENCKGVDELILLNYHHQDGVEKVYEVIQEYKQFFKHHFSDLRIENCNPLAPTSEDHEPMATFHYLDRAIAEE